MKVVYLHGLESTSRPSNPKIKWLNSNFDEVYAPQIDYKKEKTFKELLSKIKSMNPDLIVGSSMGGYFSYILIKEGIEYLITFLLHRFLKLRV